MRLLKAGLLVAHVFFYILIVHNMKMSQMRYIDLDISIDTKKIWKSIYTYLQVSQYFRYHQVIYLFPILKHAYILVLYCSTVNTYLHLFFSRFYHSILIVSIRRYHMYFSNSTFIILIIYLIYFSNWVRYIPLARSALGKDMQPSLLLFDIGDRIGPVAWIAKQSRRDKNEFKPVSSGSDTVGPSCSRLTTAYTVTMHTLPLRDQ